MKKINDEYIWVEKYRPSYIEDLILPQRELDSVNKWIIDGKIPNILLTSQNPGTGKTSLAHIIINALEADALWLNASKESGVDVVRNQIDEFSSFASMFGAPKVIILDEVDGLSHKAQEAVRGVIEEFTNVSYILTANHKHKIHEAIQNRMIKFDLDDIFRANIKEIGNKLMNRFKFILENENIEHDVKDIQKIITSSYPSIRGMIQDLQKYSSSGKLIIDARMINEKNNIQELVQQFKLKNFNKAREILNSMVNPTSIYDYVYNNIDSIVEANSIPAMIVKTHNYMSSSTRNPSISTTAYVADIMFMDQNIKFL